jgi:hypothetical protein
MLICFIKQYQTLIVGGLGFLGVMATLAFNAWLARRQHFRQIRHDANALRVALRAELEILRDAFRDRIATIGEAQPSHKSILVPLDTMTDVYGRLIDRIGLLSGHEIRPVLRAYILVRQMPERLRLLAQQQGTEIERARGFAEFGGDLFSAVRQMHGNYLTDIEHALSVISHDRVREGSSMRLFQWLARFFENDDKSRAGRFWYAWLPIVGSALALISSGAWDHLHPGAHELQRAGSILAFFGGLSAYGGATRIWDRRGDRGEMIRGVYSYIPYAKIGAGLALIGTVLWGYGDLL